MDLLVIPLILVAIMIGVAVALRQLTGSKAKSAPLTFPYKAATLLSPAERSFLGALEQAVEGRCRIFAKVRLADVVGVQRGLSRSESRSAINRISQKHADFVLSSLGDASVKAVVELDDKSHAARDRKERDDFVDRALGAAGITCLHVPAASGYSVHQLRQMLEPVFGGAVKAPIVQSAPIASNPMPVAPEQITGASPTDATTHGSTAEAAAAECPKCGSALVEREAKRGARKGERFMACSAFPSCRYTQAAS